MGLDAAQEMIAQCVAFSSQIFRPNSIVVVEAQRTYPLPDEPMGEVVAKANDCHRLAQVSGSAQALAQVFGARSVAVLPQEWKGNQKKATTLYEVQQFFPGGVLWQDGQDSQPEAVRLENLPPRAGHGIDALGIAIYAARLISSNPEAYGF
jgi:hypothetical protein